MRLTLHTDYALRMLVYLAINRNRPTRVADVAQRYRISSTHLQTVALHLGKLGYITCLRGRTGGIALARRPQDINLGQIVRQLEDHFALVECMQQNGGGCVISPACRLKGIVGKALEAFFSVFDAYTLADIAGNSTMLTELLSLESGSSAAA